MKKFIFLAALAYALSTSAYANPFEDEIEIQNLNSTSLPVSITFEGRDDWSYWQTFRSVTYANGAIEKDAFRNGTNNPQAALGHYVFSTNKPANASTQWLSFNLKNTDTSDKYYIDHIVIMARATLSGSIPNYQARGLAVWPSKPELTTNGINPCTSPTNDNYKAIRQEYFTTSGVSEVDPNCINVNIKFDSPLKIVMHVTSQASAAWVYSVATGKLLGSTSWASGHAATNGTGLFFGAVCSNPSDEMDPNCFYKNQRSTSNRPFKIEFTDIKTGWF